MAEDEKAFLTADAVKKTSPMRKTRLHDISAACELQNYHTFIPGQTHGNIPHSTEERSSAPTSLF